MSGHFRAFSFVDRVLAIEDGHRIRGSYTVPATLPSFPLALVGEAVGQLAAWAVMSARDFKCRPVAGLALQIDLLGDTQPGHVLDLSADLVSVDDEAVDYHGMAYSAGVPVIRLHHCVGPMLPTEQFDDPRLLRERFALICGDGASPGAFDGLTTLPLEVAPSQGEQSLQATLQVPATAGFFADHFPRWPVLPGTMLLHKCLELASMLAAKMATPAIGGHWRLCGISDMKLRGFTAPGTTLEIEARLSQSGADQALLSVRITKEGRAIGAANVRFEREDSP